VPEWLDRSGHSARVMRMPGREDVDLPINEELIVAFYAR
jgi:ribosomal protein S4